MNKLCILLICTVIILGLIGLDKHAESKVKVKSIEELMR